MSNKYKLSQSTIEQLEYYVYLLIDPRDDSVFYVGKGCGNRINQHVLGALDDNTFETAKIKKIREIQNKGMDVKSVILRHELTEDEAFEVECSVIDLLGINNLTNIVKGHDSTDKGMMNLEDIKIKYEAEDVIITEPLVLININKKYHRGMNSTQIYEATRKDWPVNIRRVQNIKLACSVFRGIIREVFLVDSWFPSKDVQGRYVFKGEIAPSDIRNKYLNKSVSSYWKKGSRFPIKYVKS